ncbi:hypothetical protein C7M84_023058 [Penaeus vannamei]|uniref:Uncharacterized protein n=1 Tax=Penaeus vannamei TaxID=6689 RepID=A0A423U4Z0_PENVA|nr:hypothetical protein C7M84_023058 [Penaeus vannamei]
MQIRCGFSRGRSTYLLHSTPGQHLGNSSIGGCTVLPVGDCTVTKRLPSRALLYFPSFPPLPLPLPFIFFHHHQTHLQSFHPPLFLFPPPPPPHSVPLYRPFSPVSHSLSPSPPPPSPPFTLSTLPPPFLPFSSPLPLPPLHPLHPFAPPLSPSSSPSLLPPSIPFTLSLSPSLPSLHPPSPSLSLLPSPPSLPLHLPPPSSPSPSPLHPPLHPPPPLRRIRAAERRLERARARLRDAPSFPAGLMTSARGDVTTAATHLAVPDRSFFLRIVGGVRDRGVGGGFGWGVMRGRVSGRVPFVGSGGEWGGASGVGVVRRVGVGREGWGGGGARFLRLGNRRLMRDEMDAAQRQTKQALSTFMSTRRAANGLARTDGSERQLVTLVA